MCWILIFNSTSLFTEQSLCNSLRHLSIKLEAVDYLIGKMIMYQAFRENTNPAKYLCTINDVTGYNAIDLSIWCFDAATSVNFVEFIGYKFEDLTTIHSNHCETFDGTFIELYNYEFIKLFVANTFLRIRKKKSISHFIIHFSTFLYSIVVDSTILQQLFISYMILRQRQLLLRSILTLLKVVRRRNLEHGCSFRDNRLKSPFIQRLMILWSTPL